MREDWDTKLPQEKGYLYERVVHDWEDAYTMLSVALSEALANRAQGELVWARGNAEIAAAVVNRLADPLLAAYRTLAIRGRLLSMPPSVNPLNPEFFRGEIGQHHAMWNQFLHRILLGSRSRYLHKLKALEMTVSAVADDFQETAKEIAFGLPTRPLDSWRALDALHYDLNTCLRETIVILKSFLRVLPEASLEAFGKEMDASVSSARFRAHCRLSQVSS